MKTIKLQQILNLLTCVLMMAAAGIIMSHKIVGHKLSSDDKTQTDSTAVARTLADGTLIINTTVPGKDIQGYAGNVPLEIYVKQGVITRIEALPNNEAPDFFKQAATLLSKWVGKTPKEATVMKVDAITGATYSSRAIIGNVRVGMKYALPAQAKKYVQTVVKTSADSEFQVSVKFLVGLIVALMAAVLPLFVHDKRYRIVQMALNVVVLGFWCGTFLSYSLMLNFISNGVNIWIVVVPLIMIITAFIYPLFGKKQYYCTNVCPFGSLQTLANKCCGKKIKLSNHTVKWLDYFRQALWAVLMLCLWTGVLFAWIDYEPFSAFIFRSAAPAVIIIAMVFAVLSLFVNRPYCRFVCPTGTLFKISEMSKR